MMESKTNMPDKDFNVISVLYHVLKGAELAEIYRRDAEEAGDTELIEFFKDTKGQYMMLADRAKKLTASRIG